jgi:hypothetical protein
MPDVHSGYGFAIGNVAAFDMADPQAVVSPGGVGVRAGPGRGAPAPLMALRTDAAQPARPSDVRPPPLQIRNPPPSV